MVFKPAIRQFFEFMRSNSIILCSTLMGAAEHPKVRAIEMAVFHTKYVQVSISIVTLVKNQELDSSSFNSVLSLLIQKILSITYVKLLESNRFQNDGKLAFFHFAKTLSQRNWNYSPIWPISSPIDDVIQKLVGQIAHLVRWSSRDLQFTVYSTLLTWSISMIIGSPAPF